MQSAAANAVCRANAAGGYKRNDKVYFITTRMHGLYALHIFYRKILASCGVLCGDLLAVAWRLLLSPQSLSCCRVVQLFTLRSGLYFSSSVNTLLASQWLPIVVRTFTVNIHIYFAVIFVLFTGRNASMQEEDNCQFTTNSVLFYFHKYTYLYMYTYMYVVECLFVS